MKCYKNGVRWISNVVMRIGKVDTSDVSVGAHVCEYLQKPIAFFFFSLNYFLNNSSCQTFSQK